MTSILPPSLRGICLALFLSLLLAPLQPRLSLSAPSRHVKFSIINAEPPVPLLLSLILLPLPRIHFLSLFVVVSSSLLVNRSSPAPDVGGTRSPVSTIHYIPRRHRHLMSV